MITTGDKVEFFMDQVVAIIRDNGFEPEYREKATVEACLGIAIANYLDWDARIFVAFYEALTDANFHPEAAQVKTIAEKVMKVYSLSTFKKAA